MQDVNRPRIPKPAAGRRRLPVPPSHHVGQNRHDLGPDDPWPQSFQFRDSLEDGI